MLRAFREGKTGALIYGMGALGKSSLAARVTSRMQDYKPVVIFERYDALTIFDALLDALPPALKAGEKSQWREQIGKSDPAPLEYALQAWLSGPLNESPVLLVIDDLERILETPAKSDEKTGVKTEWRAALSCVIRAFDRTPTRSRLLLTSRYDFRLPDSSGRDLSETLTRVPLKPMEAREREKQWRAAERVAGRQTEALDEKADALLARALDAAAGNPGLQAILTKPILAREYAAAEEALRQIGVYRETGAPPQEIQKLIDEGKAKDSQNALTAFFARISFATYRAALNDEQARQLGAATLFLPEIPIPLAALAAAGQAQGVETPGKAIARLLGLGLFDDWGEFDGVPHASVNPLARPLAAPLDAADRPRLARAAMRELAKAWRDEKGGFPYDPRGLVAAEIALAAGAEPEVLEAAVLAGAGWLHWSERETRQALTLVDRACAALPAGFALNPEFARLGLECAARLGAARLRDRLLAAPLRAAAAGDIEAQRAHAALDLRRAENLRRKGDVAHAESLTRDALAKFQALGDVRSCAVTMSQIADILQARGELDEALRIRREEELAVASATRASAP